MPIKVLSAGVLGIQAHPVEVEVDMSTGSYGYQVVGLPDVAVRESKERVRSALRNGGFEMPREKIVVNLTPAHLPKAGTAYDLPIALGILQAADRRRKLALNDVVVVGELGLSGVVRPISGVMAMALEARAQGATRIVVPLDNAVEASVVPGL